MAKKRNIDIDGELATKTRVRTQRPARFKVILLNDDYTSMEFVIMVLMSVFNKTNLEAVEIMLAIHTGGRGIAGIYTREVAETKVSRVDVMAQSEGYPLRCVLERE